MQLDNALKKKTNCCSPVNILAGKLWEYKA
jgi:hypothetical protein